MENEIEKDIKVSKLYAQISEMEQGAPKSIYAYRIDHSCQMASQTYPCIHLLGAASDTSDAEAKFLGDLREIADEKDGMIVIHCQNDLLLTQQEAQKLGYSIRPFNNSQLLASAPKSIREVEAKRSVNQPPALTVN